MRRPSKAFSFVICFHDHAKLANTFWSHWVWKQIWGGFCRSIPLRGELLGHRPRLLHPPPQIKQDKNTSPPLFRGTHRFNSIFWGLLLDACTHACYTRVREQRDGEEKGKLHVYSVIFTHFLDINFSSLKKWALPMTSAIYFPPLPLSFFWIRMLGLRSVFTSLQPIET